MIEMSNFMGLCMHCGAEKGVMAVDQIDANNKVSDECDCRGAVIAKSVKELVPKVSRMFDGRPDIMPYLKNSIDSVAGEIVDRVTIKIGYMTVVISMADDGVKVKKVIKTTEEA